jgi:hypothetical protein
MSATQESWAGSPMPRRRRRITIERHYDADERERIAAGHVPVSQDDRWFVWVGDDVVHIHRSWSGFEVYRIRLQPSDDGAGFDVSDVWVNNDPEQYEGLPHVEVDLVGSILDALAGR